METFKNYSKYYDLFYKEKNYKRESNYIIKKINQFAPNSSQILEFGSGSGSHAYFFCEANWY